MAFAKLASLINSTPTGGTFTTGSMDTTGANLLVVLLSFASGGTCNLTDSQGNVFTGIADADFGLHTQLFYKYAPSTSASHTFSAISVGTTYPTIAAIAFSGSAASPVDQQNAATDIGSTIDAGSVTPSEDNELLVTGVSSNAGTYTSISSPFTLEQSVAPGANNYGLAIGYEIQAAAASRNPTWTTSGASGFEAAVIASFKAAAVGGGVVIPVLQNHYRQLRQR